MISKIIGAIVGTITFLVAVTIVFGSWYTVDDGYRGVLLRNGAFVSVAEPGLNFKTPWIEEVVEISVRDSARKYGDETVFEAYSKDQQIADLVVSVNYRIPTDRVAEVYSSYGSQDNLVARVLDRQIYEKVKTVFGQFNAASAIQERGRLNAEVTKAVTSGVGNNPILVTSVQIEDISFSEAYNNSIEERMKAEVEVARLRQQHEQTKVQAQIVVTQAEANAQAIREQAQAEADAIELRGRAEAIAIDVRGKALRDNPDLIGLVQAEKWDGKLPSTMLPGGTVPFLNVSPEKLNDRLPQ